MAILEGMSNRTREKQALVVFILLVFIGMGGLIWYLFAGHSWNVTASNIDESVGQMEGYTAIVFDGTMPEKTSSASKGKSSVKAEADSTTSSKTEESSTLVTDDMSASGTETNDKAASSSGSVDSNVSAEASMSADSEQQTKAETNSDSELQEYGTKSATDSNATSTSTAESASTQSKSSATESKKPLQASEVRDNYVDKGASVLTLDVSDPSIYSEGTIVKRAGKRIGIVSIEKPLNEVSAKRLLSQFVSAQVDIVVCIAPEASYVKGISGIDIVVCTEDEEVSTTGQTEGKTFIVNAPTVGSVGAVLVSPSNVVSAKVLDHL